MATIQSSTAHPAFRFVVEVDGISQAVFTECSLPNIDWDVKEITEGGLNEYIHQLPGRRKVAKITLKSGLGTSDLLDWYINCMGERWVRRNVSVKLLDVAHKKVMSWHLEKAFPSKWSSPSLKSDDNSIAIESLELAFGAITVEK